MGNTVFQMMLNAVYLKIPSPSPSSIARRRERKLIIWETTDVIFGNLFRGIDVYFYFHILTGVYFDKQTGSAHFVFSSVQFKLFIKVSFNFTIVNFKNGPTIAKVLHTA